MRQLVPLALLGPVIALGCDPAVTPDPGPPDGTGGATATGGASTTAGTGGTGATGGFGGTGGTGGAAGSAALGGSGGAGTAGQPGAGNGGVAGSATGGVAGTAFGNAGNAGDAGTAGGDGGTGAVAGSTSNGGAGAAGSAGTEAGSGGTAGSGGDANGPCTASGLTFCTDFEDLTTGMPPAGMGLGTHLNGNGTVAVDGTTAAHSGTKSIKVNATGYQTFFKLTGAPVFPAVNGKLYVRVYLRLGAAMTGGHNTYFEAGLDAASDAPYETRVGVMNEMLMINQPNGDRGFLSNENYYVDHLPGTVIPATTWTCVEAFFDTPASTVSFWVEGADVPDLHRTDWQQENYDALRFGYEKYAGPDAELWYDDLAVGNERIGCFP